MTAALRKPAKPALPKRGSQPLLTSEEFLDWLKPGIHADLIGGEIHMHSPVNLRHANLVNFLDRLLAHYLDEIESTGVLHRETVAVRLSGRETFLPDLCYFTGAQAARLGETHATFAPTFVMEALSRSTAKNDRGQKFAAYERHGVQEYWLLDPEGLDHRFYFRAGDLFEEFGDGVAKIESWSIPGFWVKRAWLNPDKIPSVKACVREIMRGSKR